MPTKKYIVSLRKNERQILQELTQKGKAAVRKINHARILLLRRHESRLWVMER